MAIDTRTERQSAHRAANPWGRIMPNPDGTIISFDRAHILGIYGTPGVADTTVTPASSDTLGATRKANTLGAS